MEPKNPNINNKYFTVKLSGDVTRRIVIPAKFARKESGKTRWYFKLKSVYRQKLFMAQIIEDEGKYYLSRGWKWFVNFHKLTKGSFVIFSLISLNTFEVFIVRKQVPKITPSKDKANPSGRLLTSGHHTHRNVKQKMEEKGEAKRLDNDPNFIYSVRNYDRNYVILPIAFARDTNIIDLKSVVVIDEKERSWELEVVVRGPSYGGSLRVELMEWLDCCEANNLIEGDLCMFKFIKSDGNIIRFKKINK